MNLAFQQNVWEWGCACFGEGTFSEKTSRNHRFIEEALELVQSLGCEKEAVLQIVNYVFNRPAGVPFQEIGGTAVTLMGLCSANKFIAEDCATVELQRCWDRIEKIRAKELAKPEFSVLPGDMKS